MRNQLLLPAAVIALCLLCASCKKDKTTTGNDGVYKPMVDEIGGWKKVGMIKYTYQNLGDNNNNTMHPEDIQQVDRELYVLYSEDHTLAGASNRQFYKGKLIAARGDTAVITKIELPWGTDKAGTAGLCYQRFLPGTYTAVGLRFLGNPAPNDYLGIFDETNNKVNDHFIGHASKEVKLYSNGDVMSGSIDYTGNAEMDFYDREVNSWTYLKGNDPDTTTLVAYTPFRLPNGALCAFNVTNNAGRTYLSIANAGNGIPVYRSIFMQQMPQLAYVMGAGNAPYLLGCAQDGNTFTVVLGTSTSGTPTHPDKIYAYKWKQGEENFTTIYSDVTITDYEGLEFATGIKCTAEGMLYKWLPGPNNLSGDVVYADRLGIHHTANISYPNNVSVGALTYIDHSFYMCAYFMTDRYTENKMRMDIIRFVM